MLPLLLYVYIEIFSGNSSIISSQPAMAILFPLLSSLLLIILVGAEQHGSVSTPQAYWNNVLPRTPIPSALQQLLPASDASVTVGKDGVIVNTGKGTTVNVGFDGVSVNTANPKPGSTAVNVGQGGVSVQTGRKDSPGGTSVDVGKGGVGVSTGPTHKPGGTSVNVGKGGVGVSTGPTHKPGGTTVNVGKGGVGVDTNPKGKHVVVQVKPKGTPFQYIYAADETQLHDDPFVALFFLQKDLRRGTEMTMQLAEDGGGSKRDAFIPRTAAKSIPFSTAELPTALSRLGISEESYDAEVMKGTLSKCEAAPAKGETRKCVTSLEDMVDYATERLGTREVQAAATEGGGGAERRRYRVEAVKKVAAAGGKAVVVCHREEYAYAVFYCHGTLEAEVYVVRLVAVDGGAAAAAAKAVAVCHTETAGWNPKHLAFRVLGVKPGTVPVCHFLPQDHVVWAAKA